MKKLALATLATISALTVGLTTAQPADAHTVGHCRAHLAPHGMIRHTTTTPLVFERHQPIPPIYTGPSPIYGPPLCNYQGCAIIG